MSETIIYSCFSVLFTLPFFLGNEFGESELIDSHRGEYTYRSLYMPHFDSNLQYLDICSRLYEFKNMISEQLPVECEVLQKSKVLADVEVYENHEDSDLGEPNYTVSIDLNKEY